MQENGIKFLNNKYSENVVHYWKQYYNGMKVWVAKVIAVLANTNFIHEQPSNIFS